MSGTRLVLTLALDGGTPAEVRAYGEQVLASIRQRARAGDPASIEWRPEQLVDARLVEVDEQPTGAEIIGHITGARPDERVERIVGRLIGPAE